MCPVMLYTDSSRQASFWLMIPHYIHRIPGNFVSTDKKLIYVNKILVIDLNNFMIYIVVYIYDYLSFGQVENR